MGLVYVQSFFWSREKIGGGRVALLNKRFFYFKIVLVYVSYDSFV